ncbi:GIY-YIG nuclease family protein [Streptomyces sp. NPDC005775]|uniref:GIY-YIG nuclease family protein n=1 Tax=Streptomyces sp. NPDC005775 TaxID=3364729 RepID=UPI0036BBD859
MAMPPPGRTGVYRFSNAKNQILYIGLTSNPSQRWAQHASDKEWWHQVWMREIEWFPTREEAEAEEARLISVAAPLYNKNGGTTRQRKANPRSMNYWKPDEDFVSLARRHMRAVASLAAARADLESAIVATLRSGIAARHIEPHVPWTGQTLYALGRRDGMEKRGEPTVMSPREAAMRQAKENPPPPAA